jgi:hypothetical protein
VFRDSRGVVHTVSSADPLEDLPPVAATALQEALLTPVSGDLGSAIEKCDAARDLLERWQDAFFGALPEEIDLEEEARWAAAAGMSLEEFEGYDDPDEAGALDLTGLDDAEDLAELLLDEEDDADPRALLPEELVAVLERELLLLPLRTRLEALVAAGDLVTTWADLLADHEKLLGHLLLRHGGGGLPLDHEPLADEHARRHAATGPGHPPVVPT